MLFSTGSNNRLLAKFNGSFQVGEGGFGAQEAPKSYSIRYQSSCPRMALLVRGRDCGRRRGQLGGPKVQRRGGKCYAPQPFASLFTAFTAAPYKGLRGWDSPHQDDASMMIEAYKIGRP